MKGCVWAVLLLVAYIVILTWYHFGIWAGILMIAVFYGFFKWLLKDVPDDKSTENPNSKAPGCGSKDSMSALNQAWDMHISSDIFGFDDYSGFSGFGKGKGGGE